MSVFGVHRGWSRAHPRVSPSLHDRPPSPGHHPSMRTLVSGLALGLLVPLLPTGCVESCDLSARAAVNLHLVDQATGQAIADATISYTVDGEAQPDEGALIGSDAYALGIELAGHYEVHIEAPGHMAVDRSYDVDEGECHVESVSDEIEMPPA